MKPIWHNAVSLLVDPDNRLVASVLEAEWNSKLRELDEARAIEEQYNQSDQHQVSVQERAEIEEVPERFRQFWDNPKTMVRERKRMARLLLEDVTVHKTDQIVAHLRTHREEQRRPSPLRFPHRLPSRV
jgi:hypothetical protein